MTDVVPHADATDDVAAPRLTIRIRVGLGAGPTRLAAFDAALRQAGIADRNLIRLSSIIPPGATVDRTTEGFVCPGGWGDRLYVVMADERVETHHDEAWAGIAWRQDLDTGAGLFVEHEGHSNQQVSSELVSSMESISVARSGHRWGPIGTAVVGTACVDEPVCAIAAACYEHEPWRGGIVDIRDAD